MRLLPNMDFTGIELFQAGDDAQQRGLAAARRPEKGDEFVTGDAERNILKHHCLTKGLGYVTDFDAVHAGIPLT